MSDTASQATVQRMRDYIEGLQAKQTTIPHMEYSPGKRVDIREHWARIRKGDGFKGGTRGFSIPKRSATSKREQPDAEFHKRNFDVALGWVNYCLDTHIDQIWTEGIRDEDKEVHLDYMLTCIAVVQWIIHTARTNQRFEDVPHWMTQWNDFAYDLCDPIQSYSFAEAMMSEARNNPLSTYRRPVL